MKLMEWGHELKVAVGLDSDEFCPPVERRKEARRDVTGLKVIVRQRKALGILHLKNLSSRGTCGITDMPLAVGSLVFLELRKPHFFAAEVRWARNVSIGLEFFRPVRPDMLEKIESPAAAAEPKKRAGKH